MEKTQQENKNSIYIKGLGRATIIGELDLRKSIESLLKNKYITG